MTENEAIEEIKENMLCDYCIAGCYECDISSCSNKDAFGIVIKALEEVQQYREIGTVEECRKNKDFLQFLSDRMPTYFEMYLRTYNVLKEKGHNK